MATTSLTTVALDGGIDTDVVSARIAWPELRRYPYGVALQADQGRVVYLFAFGAVVYEGYAGLDPALQATIEAVSGRRALADTVDVWSLDYDPAARGARVRVGWDRIVLPAPTPELLAATALLLGQSAALERYEHSAEQLIAEARRLAEALVVRGRPPSTSRPLVRQVGRINQDRLAVVAEMYILDRPEETWERPDVATLYDELLAGLELPQRHETLLRKLETVESTTRLVIELWHGRSANQLEWAIVLLIVFEILWTLGEHLLS